MNEYDPELCSVCGTDIPADDRDGLQEKSKAAFDLRVAVIQAIKRLEAGGPIDEIIEDLREVLQ